MKRIILMALVLAGCSPAADVEHDVAAALKDPASAEFGEITVRGDGISRIACGTVNSKNSFGGYTGHQPFMAKGGLLYIGFDRACCEAHMGEAGDVRSARIVAGCESRLPVPVLIEQ
jgi:hypothetical protein